MIYVIGALMAGYRRKRDSPRFFIAGKCCESPCLPAEPPAADEKDSQVSVSQTRRSTVFTLSVEVAS